MQILDHVQAILLRNYHFHPRNGRFPPFLLDIRQRVIHVASCITIRPQKSIQSSLSGFQAYETSTFSPCEQCGSEDSLLAR
jgi:hypothetical protein